MLTVLTLASHNTKVMRKKDGRYHHPDLRQTLLDHAARLIKSDGLRDFSLRKLAAEAGVSHAAPYRHFESKEEILATLMLEGHRRLRTELLAARDSCRGKCADKLLALGRAYLGFASSHPEYLAVMFSRESMAAAASLREKLAIHEEDHDSFGVLHGLVKACQAEGSLDAKSDAGFMSLLIWSEVHGLALLRNEGIIARMCEKHGQSEGKALDAIFKMIRGRYPR
jgi:AcrR family transcriptional regulator